jgi:hypothetical protein
MSEYQTVFVVLQKSPPSWVFVIVPTAVAVFTMLAIVAFVKYKTRRVAVVVIYVVTLFMVWR